MDSLENLDPADIQNRIIQIESELDTLKAQLKRMCKHPKESQFRSVVLALDGVQTIRCLICRSLWVAK